jgi:hypothetical protein
MRPIRARSGRRRAVARDLRKSAGVDEATRRLLQYVMVPLWIAAGLGDWACHRASNIETTAGVEESAIHSLMLAESALH